MTGHPRTSRTLDIADCPAGVDLLARVRRGLERRLAGFGNVSVPLRSLAAETRALVLEALGEGDIQADIDGSEGHPRTLLRETAFAGVWYWQRLGPASEVLDDGLEIGDCPQLMLQCAFQSASARLEWPPEHDADTLGAVGVLAELAAHLDAWRRAAWPGGGVSDSLSQPASGNPQPHCVNLGLMPLTPADRVLLDRTLGQGPVRILNRAYGQCEIEATGVRPIWRVRHFNCDGRRLLDSLEIANLPSAVVATAEDLADSDARLGELCVMIGAAHVFPG